LIVLKVSVILKGLKLTFAVREGIRHGALQLLAATALTPEVRGGKAHRQIIHQPGWQFAVGDEGMPPAVAGNRQPQLAPLDVADCIHHAPMLENVLRLF